MLHKAWPPVGCYIPAWAPRAGSTKPTCLGGWWGRQDFGHKSLPCLKKELHPNSGIRTNKHSSSGKANLRRGEDAIWLSLSTRCVYSHICQGAVPSRGIWKAFSRASPKSWWLHRAGWQSCAGSQAVRAGPGPKPLLAALVTGVPAPVQHQGTEGICVSLKCL